MNSKRHQNRKDVKRVSRSETYQRLRRRAEEERKALDQARRDLKKVTEERDAALMALSKKEVSA